MTTRPHARATKHTPRDARTTSKSVTPEKKTKEATARIEIDPDAMTIPRIQAIVDALIALDDMNVPFGYAVAKNLAKGRAVLIAFEKHREDANRKHAEKDENGEYIIDLINMVTGKRVTKWDRAADSIPKGHQKCYRMSEEAEAEVNKWYAEAVSEHHHIEWHRIEASKLDTACIPSRIQRPLLDVIIVDTL